MCLAVLKASQLAHLDMAAAQQLQQQSQGAVMTDQSALSTVTPGLSTAVSSSCLASLSASAAYLTDEASLSNRER
jgi:hypothetical protein